jgi:hypothetical protein
MLKPYSGTIIHTEAPFTDILEFETSEEGVCITRKLRLKDEKTDLLEDEIYLSWEDIQHFLDHKPTLTD